ncbi:unnamed protein product [Brassicogethes aeneus]|uniref:G-protein coupled receptors family 1 profile domain-containing protein n=1 Tax=Brassicogethes aeneus TaxID=1431903 RepID=A0A9P0BF19_BRAAE|nr:unnamed protein product [Brassicogethes aeneus]
MDNSTLNATLLHKKSAFPKVIYFVMDFVFIIGAAANILALWIIYKSSRNRNKKHVFLLRCLATNDLVAQIGMLTVINLNKGDYWTCVGFVLLRGFGLGSGSVAFVMALERWMALTRPFLYHQIVTYKSLKMFTFALWGGAQILTYLPLTGMGLFYSPGHCLSYREATITKDVIYAYAFFAFATSLCLCIALCNTTVVIELMKIQKQSKVLVRRVSRSIINNSCSRYQTPEEVAFAKLMAIICLIFVCCWVPQLISHLLFQFYPDWKYTKIHGKVANFLTCVYFTTDPFVYVLQRYNREVWRYLVPCCFLRRSTTSLSNTGTTTTLGTPTTVLLQPPTYNMPVDM